MEEKKIEKRGGFRPNAGRKTKGIQPIENVTAKEAEILKLYSDYASIRDIENICSVSSATIYVVLKRYEIPKRGKKSIPPQTRIDVVKKYTAGASIQKIIAETKVMSEQTIYSILDENKVTRRREKNNN